MDTLSDHDHCELVMLYQVTLDDIEKAKRWGWAVTYTTIAAQGGLIALFTVYVPLVSAWIAKLLFAVMIVSATALARDRIKQSESSLAAARARLLTTRDRLGALFRQSFGGATPKELWPLEPVLWYSTAAFLLLLAVAVGGARA